MSKKWVLIVDDDPVILTILESAIAHPDLTVTTANDALQAFIQARDLKPLAIVSDIRMPGFGDGTTTLKRLRQDPRVPRCPFIFMTALDREEAQKLLPKDDPMIGLMTKPVDLKSLRAYIWQLAGVSQPAAPGVAAA